MALVKNLPVNETVFDDKRLSFSSRVGKIPWRRAWQPPPVFSPRKSHEQKSQVGYRSLDSSFKAWTAALRRRGHKTQGEEGIKLIEKRVFTMNAKKVSCGDVCPWTHLSASNSTDFYKLLTSLSIRIWLASFRYCSWWVTKIVIFSFKAWWIHLQM